MKIALSLIPLVLWSSAVYGKKKESTTIDEVCFVEVVQGGTVALKLVNHARDAHSVTVQPWLPDGTPGQKSSQIVPGATTTEMRVDVAPSDTAIFALFQVIQDGHSIEVAANYEYLYENSLTTIPMLPIFRVPVSEAAVQSAFKYSIHHRYTYDVFALRGALYVFVNLSDYPVQAGMCQENYPDCVLSSLPYTVQPHAILAFPIDQQRRFLVMHSSPGYSVATAIDWTEGLQQRFGANSSITFGPVK